GTATFCPGGSTTLTSSVATGNIWSTGQTTQSISVNTAGSYSVRRIVSGCTSLASTAVNVTPSVTAPTISGNALLNIGGSTVLTSSSATGNLWSNGATTQSITVTTMGRYSVRFISGTCTSAASDEFVVDLNVTNYEVSTFAGSGTAAFADGTGTAASFNRPYGVATDATGNIYVADFVSNRIRKMSPSGVVTTLAGSGAFGATNGPGTSASFYFPMAVAVDAAGNVYVADYNNNRIRKVSSTGVVSTLAGSGTAGYADGTGTTAIFRGPRGIAVDAAGNVYVADADNHRIRKVSPAGVVTTLAGSGTASFADGTGTAASFNFPNGLALDASGNIYVADESNNRIRKISPAGVVTTFAGSTSFGNSNGIGTNARFTNPTGVAVDLAGNVFVADRGNNRIRKISPAGLVTTVAGSGSSGSANGIGTAASFNSLSGVAVDAAGNVYVADLSNNLIRKLTPSCAIPATPTISGEYAFCTGGSTTLTSSSATGNLWSTGATTQSITVSTAGNYSVRVIDGSCTSAVSATFDVFNGTPATPTILGNNIFCAGGSTTLTSSSATGNLWSTGETTQSITVSTAGDYSVRVIDGSCTSAVSTTSNVVNSTPITPTISGNTTINTGGSTVLTSSSATGNLWSNGATTESITVTTMGRYSVRVISGTCTSAASNELVVDLNVSNYEVSTFAGSGTAGATNGTGTSASFNSPQGVVVDGA
ncbi:MAG: hypothetical protein ACOVMN_12835, partial [Flexibacteraceae bacterium]